MTTDIYDPVNLPEHYSRDDSIECIDAMAAAFGEDEVQDYCRINAFKYVWRAHLKGKEEEDIRKAIWYLRRSIGEDKDVKDFVLGYQLSAVLDERTSDICELVAEIEPTIKVEDEATLNELTPPLHFNCRTILTFVTKDDAPIQWTDEGDLQEIIAMVGLTE